MEERARGETDHARLRMLTKGVYELRTLGHGRGNLDKTTLLAVERG